MQCEMCKAQEATVHLTQVMDGVVRKMHLCEGCAAKSGVDTKGGVSLTDLLVGLGQMVAGAGEAPDSGRACPRCHLRQSDFKNGGRLGCPECYEAFAAELAPLIHAMHRRDRHTGKVPRRATAAVGLDGLQRELSQAIAAENYELAAQLRDRIQTLRRGAPGGGSAG